MAPFDLWSCNNYFLYSKPHGGWVIPEWQVIGEYIEVKQGNHLHYPIWGCVISKRGKKAEDRAKFCDAENLEAGSQVRISNGGLHNSWMVSNGKSCQNGWFRVTPIV